MGSLDARRAFLLFGAIAVGVAAAGFGLVVWFRASRDVADLVAPHRPVVVLGGRAWAERAGEGARAAAADPGLAEALGGRSGDAVSKALARAGVTSVLVPLAEPARAEWLGTATLDPRSVAARLAALERVAGLRAAVLRPDLALYVAAEGHGIEPRYGDALAVVARALLEGQPAPAVESFPERLRRFENPEVLVLLKEGTRPRLWRSARTGSLAKGTVTAALAARERWTERAQAMGAPLDAALPGLSVEVARFDEDGTLLSLDAPFLDRAVTAAHGIAYERKNAWRYTLPGQIERTPGGVRRALELLLRGDDLDVARAEREGVRFYRFAVRTLGVSAPRTAASEPGR